MESQYLGAEKTGLVSIWDRQFRFTTAALTCDALSVVLDFVTIHTHLVRADDGLETVLLAEALGNIRTELHANTTLAGPTALLVLRIRPEHLHHETSLSRLSLVVAVELADIVKGDVVVGEETAVQDEVLLANEGGERKGREGLGEELE